MNTPSPPNVDSREADDRPDFRFDGHKFEVYCYDTTGCRVLYNNFYHVRDAEDVTRPPAPEGDYRSRWGPASYLDVPNFPPPAVVKWRSKDGEAHEAEVDIGAIFADRKILMMVPKSAIPERAHIRDPGIYLEVNDRTINVFMRAFVPLKEPSIPGNRFSRFAVDLIQVYSKTY